MTPTARLGPSPLAPLCLAEANMAGSFWSLPPLQGVASGLAVSPELAVWGCGGSRFLLRALRCPRTVTPSAPKGPRRKASGGQHSLTCLTSNQGRPKAIRKVGPCSPFPSPISSAWTHSHAQVHMSGQQPPLPLEIGLFSGCGLASISHQLLTLPPGRDQSLGTDHRPTEKLVSTRYLPRVLAGRRGWRVGVLSMDPRWLGGWRTQGRGSDQWLAESRELACLFPPALPPPPD